MPIKSIGFTGTQRGMTEAQRLKLGTILAVGSTKGVGVLHHGDCVGADAQAHELAQKWMIPVIIHPPENSSKRAFCGGSLASLPPQPYLVRNHFIVDACDVLVATPGEATEQLRSGTWATIRYARKRHKTVVIIYPDGSHATQS